VGYSLERFPTLSPKKKKKKKKKINLLENFSSLVVFFLYLHVFVRKIIVVGEGDSRNRGSKGCWQK
jgi:hypothetical protein